MINQHIPFKEIGEYIKTKIIQPVFCIAPLTTYIYTKFPLINYSRLNLSIDGSTGFSIGSSNFDTTAFFSSVNHLYLTATDCHIEINLDAHTFLDISGSRVKERVARGLNVDGNRSIRLIHEQMHIRANPLRPVSGPVCPL